MKKKILTTLSVVLVLALAALGILAYLSDADSDVNVMTLGNVQIEQIEQEWNADGTALQDFTQAKPLYPYVGELGWKYENGEEAYRQFTMNNAVDKYVSVKNTGKSDAYVRTFIALEMGDYSYDEFNMVGVSINNEDGDEFDFPGTWQWADDFVASIDGKNYNVMVAVHKDPLEPGETTIPSLLQVYLKDTATNETVEKLDGNGNGTYDILVFSEAVQTEGFDDAKTALNTAFGDPSDPTRYHPWGAGVKIPVVVASAKDLTEAFAAKDSVVLKGTIDGEELVYPYGENYAAYTAEYYAKQVASIEGGNLILDNNRYDGFFAFEVGLIKDTVINGTNRNTLTVQNRKVATTLENVSVTAKGGSAITVENGTAGVVLNNVTVKWSGVGEGVPAYLETALFISANSKVTINSGTYTSTKYALRTAGSGASTVTINGGAFNGGIYVAADNGDTVIINGGTFSVDPRNISGVTVNGTVTEIDGKYVVK